MKRLGVLIAAVASVLATEAHAQMTTFKVRIENVSQGTMLRSMAGATAPVAIAPTLWVVHTQPAPLFTEGQPDRGKGLEALAEDGNPGPLAESP